MVVDEVLQKETSYAPGQQQTAEQTQRDSPVGAFTDRTKGDVEFWIQVLQLLVLLLILQEVSR